jgi:trehalose 6-phosphate synthase
MNRWRSFLLLCVAGLGCLAWVGSLLVSHTTRGWFERDLKLRAELVVHGARRHLCQQWMYPNHRGLTSALTDIARDERIMGAAACSQDFVQLASTPGYPARLSCDFLKYSLRGSIPPAEASEWPSWAATVGLPGGPVYVSAIPLRDDSDFLGFILLVHDLSFIERRETSTRNFMLAAFALLSFLAVAMTLILIRTSWLGWSHEIRRFLRGESIRSEFHPVMRDVRELVERVMMEKEAESTGGAWNPGRLKNTLSQYLHLEKIIIVANREPYIHEGAADGSIHVVHPASGLVTALEPVLRACSGTWIAHGSGSADRRTVDDHDRVRVPPGEESYTIRRVWLSGEEEKGYYYGLSNEGLWPLCHLAHARPEFRLDDWKRYREVNEKFAEAVCAEADSPDPIVLVQDYHFALVPRLLRERLPRATILTFWHIPWPNSEKFGICPWHDAILEGMLGSSILGFHTRFHCSNFLDTVDRFLEARIDRERGSVEQKGHSTLIRPYPISLEWPVSWAGFSPSPEQCRKNVLEELGLPGDALLGVGVDRLDYTKGLEERIAAIGRLLERHPEYRNRFTFIQLAAPSRTLIERYRLLDQSVESMVRQVNERFGGGGYQPIILLRAHHEPLRVYQFYRAADLCYVSSLHDGMNLVAKEFVAARDDERGVLVLSRFTGAASEMTEALLVNPYDIEDSSAALAAALRMPRDEQRDRMSSMRSFLAEFNVYRWAGKMLIDAARLRRRERLAGRVGERLLRSTGSSPA